MTTQLRLTQAQRSAVGIYVVEANALEDEPVAGVVLLGNTLAMDMDVDAACALVVEAINSADCGDGTTPDRGAVRALENVLCKLRGR